jgi:hypothetical protein
MSFVLDGRQLPLDTPFEHDGTSYPANWLRLATPEERAAIGITEVIEQPRPDDRFWWVSGPNIDGSFTSVAKDLDQIKAMLLSQIKQTTASLLAPTDYKYIRKLETGQEIDAATLQHRTDIRSAKDANEKLVNAAETVDGLSTLSFTWPSTNK